MTCASRPGRRTVSVPIPPAPVPDDLRTSPVGFDLIERFEGFSPVWYDDPVGVATIGFGWTGPLPDGFAPPLTLDDGRRLLRQTIRPYEAAVGRLVTVPLAQPQFDALVSFTYNLGASALASSTLLRKLNAGEPGVGMEFDRWVYAGGKRLPGLVRRRAAERALFESASVPVVGEDVPRYPGPPNRRLDAERGRW